MRTVRPRFLPCPRRFGSFLIMSRISGRILWPARAVWPLPPRPLALPRLPPRPTRIEVTRLLCALSALSCIKLVGAKALERFDGCARDSELVLGARVDLAHDVRDAGELEHGA